MHDDRVGRGIEDVVRRTLTILEGCRVLPAMKTETRGCKGVPNPKARKTTDRFKMLNTFVDCSMAYLGRSEIAVWLVLYRDSRDNVARTGQTDIARRSGISDRTVCRALKKLESKGLVEVIWRGRLGTGPSRYRVSPMLKPDTIRTKS